MRSRNGEFGIFPRRSRKTVFYYYWIYDNNGKRKYRSTGKKDYNEALKYCRALLLKGQLYNGTSYSFDTYFNLFFDYEKCPYIKNRLLRGYSYGRTWAKRQRNLLMKKIIPYFNDNDIRYISPKTIDDFIMHLRQANTSKKTLNHILTTIKSIFGYAKATGLIESNPTEGIKPFKLNIREKGIFSREELYSLFTNIEKTKIWIDPMHFLLNCIAASTGMRLGEILALRPENIFDAKIKIEHSWNRIEGIKGTKSGKTRIVPIPEKLCKVLENFIINNNINGFIFSVNNGRRPIDHKVVYKHFWNALSKIGISEEMRKNRNISFHSFRHTYNSFLLEAGIHPETVRLITGHSAPNMTARYSHIQLSNMPGIIEKLSIAM